jgi:vacuolar-type H+-ATPase subunit F/Vma7
VYPVKEERDFVLALEEALNNKYAVCLVQDSVYNLAKEKIDSYKSLPLPVFITFSKTGRTDLLENIVKDIRLRATGTL